MVTLIYTLYPIREVLLNGGSISLSELTEKLIARDTSLFRDEKSVKRAVSDYAECLSIKRGVVRFNKKALRYSKLVILEREVQYKLHNDDEVDMERFQLYKLRIRAHGEGCFMNIPWIEIPKDVIDSDLLYVKRCDYRAEGKDGCYLGCGIEEGAFNARRRGF